MEAGGGGAVLSLPRPGGLYSPPCTRGVVISVPGGGAVSSLSPGELHPPFPRGGDASSIISPRGGALSSLSPSSTRRIKAVSVCLRLTIGRLVSLRSENNLLFCASGSYGVRTLLDYLYSVSLLLCWFSIVWLAFLDWARR